MTQVTSTRTSVPPERGRTRGPARRGRATSSLSARRNALFWPFVLPSLAIYALLMLVPTLFTLWISLNRWRAQGDPMQFVGGGNYTRLVSNEAFRTSFWNTLEILAICGVVIFVLAFAITIAMREMRGRRLAQSMLFFPYLISPVVIAIAFGLVLNPAGLVDTGLKAVHLGFLAKEWLSPQHIFLTLVVTIIWVSTGFYVLLLMAGIDRIPRYYYEDTNLAGANAWQTFRHVTLPLNWDVVTVAAVLWVINARQDLRDDPGVLQCRGRPRAGVAHPRRPAVLRDRRRPLPGVRHGPGAAIGVVSLLLVAILVVLLRRVMRRERIEF